jgi:hypothetical protein
MRNGIADSIKAGRTSVYDSLMLKRAADSAQLGRLPTTTSTYGVDGVTITRQIPVPLPPAPRPVYDEDIPDYFPPVRGTPVLLADGDGNVWIRSLAAQQPGFDVWEVHHRERGLLYQVKLSVQKRIVGFGPGGAIYMAPRISAIPFPIERVKLGAP